MNQQIALAIEKKKHQNWIGNFTNTIEQSLHDVVSARDEIKTSQAKMSCMCDI